MAAVHDSLYYPVGLYLGTDVGADKWVSPPGMRRFEIGNVMGVSRGVGTESILNPNYVPPTVPGMSRAYWNPAHTTFGADQYVMAAHAVPMEDPLNRIMARYQPTTGRFYTMSNLFYGGWIDGSWDEQGIVASTVYAHSADGTERIVGGWSRLHTADFAIGDMDYWRLDVWGDDPVYLRLSVLEGGGNWFGSPDPYYADYAFTNPAVTHGVNHFAPPESIVAPRRILHSAIITDAHHDRIVGPGQPGIWGADQINWYIDPQGVPQSTHGMTNGTTSFYAGDADFLTARKISQSGSAAVLGGYKRAGTLVTVT